MKIKHVLTIWLSSTLYLFASSVMAVSQADRANENRVESVPAQMLVQYINHSLEATAAGAQPELQVLDTKLEPIKYHFTGTRNQEKYRSLSAYEYRRAVFGSN